MFFQLLLEQKEAKKVFQVEKDTARLQEFYLQKVYSQAEEQLNLLRDFHLQFCIFHAEKQPHTEFLYRTANQA